MISMCEQLARDFRRKAGQKPDIERSLIFITEEVKEYAEETDDVAALKELADIVYVCGGMLDACRIEAQSKGWDLNKAVQRVHDNNLGRMTDERDENGKVIKDPDYPKVDLKDLV